MRPLEKKIRAVVKKRTGHEPNIDNPQTLNDKINWLKLYDQMPEMIRCCDKLDVRNYAREKLGDGIHLLNIYQVADRFRDLIFTSPCIIKTSHDSGTWSKVSNRKDWDRSVSKIHRGLSRMYGVNNGEWAYRFVPPKCYVEQRIPDPVIEYKFHVAGGKVRWVQVMGSRTGPSTVKWEAITDANGYLLPLRLFPGRNMLTSPPILPDSWAAMIYVAEKLAEDFRYVRVDLFTFDDVIFINEMTFWPISGCYKTSHGKEFGDLMQFDMSFKRRPIVE